MALAHFIIIEVMGWRDLDASGPEFRVDIIIGNNGNSALTQRQIDKLSDQMLIACVFRVNRNGSIAKQGFRTRCGNREMLAAVGDGIVEMPEGAVLLFGDNFQIGNGGVQLRVPVDQAITSVNQSLFIKIDEDFLHHL